MRKVVEYIVQDPSSRDHGKTFELTEMPAAQAEDWAMRAFLALSAAGFEIDEEAASMGLAGLATRGIASLGKIPWSLAKPLMDEMFACIKSKQPRVTRELIEEDIEEVKTRFLLRREVLALHFEFFRAAETPRSATSTTPSPESSGASTLTSLDLSVRSSAPS